MSNQIVITSGAKVRNLAGVLTGTSGVVSSVPLGAANGVATLDSGGKVPVSQLPSSVVTYLGTWNAATNTPTLTNGVGDAGDMYICNVAGTVNFGAGPVTFAVGDWVLYGSGTWQKSSGQNGTVTSVGASINGNAIGLTGSPITTAGTLAFAFAGTSGQYVNGAGNLTTFPTLITSIGLSMPSAFSVANSPLTANGSINVTGAGTVSQYIDGTGALQTFPALTGYVPYTGATTDVDLGTHVLNAQALHVKGTAGNGHLGLKHQSATPTGSANESLIFADVNGNLGWQNGNLYLTTLVSNANTANRSYTFPNASGTLALTSDISYPVTSVFGRTGAVVATEGDYTLTQLGDVTITTPSSGQVLKYNGTAWVNNTDTDTGITTLNTLTALTQTFAVGTSGTDFTISSATSTHTFNLPTASATNRGALSSADWSTFNNKQSALTFSSPLVNTSGTVSIPAATSLVNGYLSSTDWSTFNGKQSALSGTGIVKSTAGTISYLTDNSTNWNTAYNRSLTSAAVTGTTTKTLTLNQQDGGTITASWTDINTDAVTSVFGRTGAVVATEGDYSLTQLSDVTITTPTTGQVLKYNGTIWINDTDANSGTVTSVGLSAPTGFSVTGSPVTSSGTLALAFAVGYSLPTTASQTNWDTAYTNRITSATSPLSITSNVISISQATTSTSGYLSSTDWNTFNNKQNALTNPVTGTGTATYLAKWNTSGTSLTNSIIDDDGTNASISGNLYLKYLSTIKGNFFANATTTGLETNTGIDLVLKTDFTEYFRLNNTGTLRLNAYTTNGLLKTSSSNGTIILATAGTDYQAPITLTTTGTSGAATLVSNTLNIPNYTLSGLGGIGGSGTTNYLPKFTGTSTIGNSLVYDNGTQVIIGGTTVPDSGLKTYVTNGTVGIGNYLSSTVGYIGTWTNHSLGLVTNGTNKATLDASGNLGLGVTPSAWGSSFRVFDILQQSSIAAENDAFNITLNAYYDTDWKYKATGKAQRYVQYVGNYYWFTAPSGTAGNAISFTQAMTLFSTGNLGLNTNTDAGYKLDVNGTIRAAGRISTTGGSANDVLSQYVTIQDITATNDYVLRFRNNAGSSIGYIGVISSGGVFQYNNSNGHNFTGAATFSSSVTAGGDVLVPYDGTDRFIGARYSATYYNGFVLNGGTRSTGVVSRSGDATDYIWFGTNTATERMRITNAGNVGIGTTTDSGYKLDVNGTGRFSGSVTFAGGVYNYVGTNKFFAAASGSINYLYTGSSSLTILNQADSATLFTLANTGAATFSSSVTAGGLIKSTNAGAGFRHYYNNGSGNIEVSQRSDNKLQIYAYNGTAYTDILLGVDGASTGGNVGIGTTSPNAKLTTYTSTGANLEVIHSNSGTFPKVSAIGLGSDAVGVTYTTSGGTLYTVGSAQIAALQSASSNATTDMAFYTCSGGSVTERMRITSGGNVGINIVNPTAKLQVQGVYGDVAAIFSGITTASQSFGVYINAGTNVNDYAFSVSNAAETTNFFKIKGNGTATFYSTIQTGGFGSSSARPWRLGELVTATVIGVNTTGYVSVEINGTQYNLALANLA